jgi:hypothetical protein
MTDREFILKFLNKNFEVKKDKIGFIFLDRKNIEPAMDQFTFLSLFKLIFPDYITNDNETPLIICKEWYGEYINNFAREIDLYLRDVTITLGQREWIVEKPDGTLVTVADLQKRFEEVYDPEFILNYYANWYSLEVAVISEKMMSEGYI